MEDVLIKSEEFSLPEKKELLKSDMEYEVILIDASETLKKLQIIFQTDCSLGFAMYFLKTFRLFLEIFL